MALKRKLIFMLYWLMVLALSYQGGQIIFAHPESNLAYLFAMPCWLWAIFMVYKSGDVRWR